MKTECPIVEAQLENQIALPTTVATVTEVVKSTHQAGVAVGRASKGLVKIFGVVLLLGGSFFVGFFRGLGSEAA